MVRMKWLQFVGVVLAVLVLGVSVVSARANEEELVVTEGIFGGEGLVLGEEVENRTDEGEVMYVMPHPGMLPSHALYPLKMLRDRVVEWLTFDQRGKTELMILYADKRMGAAKQLLEEGEEDLGVETGLKAVMYQERAVGMLEQLKKDGENVGELANKLERGTAKHAELWKELVDKVGEKTKPRMDEYKDKTKEHNTRMQRVLERE